MAARGQNQGNGKNKHAYAPKPKIPPPPKREDPAKDSICHECGETGHWKRNCPQYLAELLKKKKNAASGAGGGSGIFVIELNTFLNRSWIYDTGCGTHICNTTQGLRASRKLKPGALSLYVGNGQREVVEAIDNFDLSLPSILVIVLNNCHYAPFITRGEILVSCLYEDGFINRFVNNTIQVSRNNMVYFSAIPRDDIFEIDLSNSYANESSIYTVSNKRAKLDLDSALLWHYRLRHISKKRIEKLQHDGLLNSTDLRAFEKCVPCMSGKMARKPYTHQVERAKDLLGLIHTDVCGPFKITSRQGASYFVTFTDDFSRYGYVYLLKHKHEVFETFNVFQKEVENQLGNTIKSLRSDRGGKYMSQEFLDHLKDHGTIAHRTPPYTPQHNGVSERRNRTLLDMVRSMMSQTTLPKSFWDYALETAARILNMVPTKKVEKTPYEPDKLEPRSIKCIFIGYPKETMGYSFYYPPENKVLVARNIEFLENSLINQEASRSLEDLEIIQEEDMHPSIDTSLNHEEDDLEMDEPQSDIIPIRRSTRTRRPTDRMCLYIDAEEHELGDLGEPANYKAALLDPESDKWLNATNVEMQSMKDNEVWILVELPPNGKTVGSKWLFKKKTDMDGAVHTYKARLVAKGYTQTPGIDYEETFSPVADIRAIRILIAIAAYYDYEIWQMDVKTAFLNGYLNEEVYMEQPEGFVNPKYPNRVCKLKRSIYGLKQASRQWNKRFDDEIKKFGFSQNADEPSFQCYKMLNPTLESVFRNAEFLENSLINQEASGSLEDLEIIQEEDTHPSIDTSLNHEEDDLEIDEPQSDIIPIRRSTRTRRPTDRMCLYIDAEEHELGDLGEPANYKAALLDPESDKWLNAMNVEMQSMKDNEVWVLVELPPNGKTVGSKWLFKKKTDINEAVHAYKVRLMAKRYTQTPWIDYEETFSPVADIRAIRILIAIAAYYDYEIWQMDVKTAFLNGYLNEEVYMEQPEGFVNPKYPNRVCKLKRSIYGLKQESRQWNKRFDNEIKKFGFSQNVDEPCVYLKASRSNVTFLILYDDDILIMGNSILMLQDVKSYLGRCFAMKDLGEAAYILGIKIYKDRSRRLIGLCQCDYIEKILKRFHMENSKRGSIPMQEKLRLSKSKGASTPAELKRMQNVPYASAVGELHWTTVKNILKYLRNTKDMFLVYGAEAKYIAAFDASKEAVWVRKFISGLRVVPTIEKPINIYCDNTKAIAIANESGITKGARHFRAKVHYLREVIEFGDIKLEKVHTDDNLADPFTKALAFPKHSELTRNIGMLPASSLM
ncbi:retrotransposon protein, putative, ty1-copia subclass [Tanacetum coccineum]